MRIIVIYKDKTDYTRSITDFLRDFKSQTGKDLEEMDPDSMDGNQFCETYGIVEYPTIIALSDEGIMQNEWTALPLPTINEVSYYVQ